MSWMVVNGKRYKVSETEEQALADYAEMQLEGAGEVRMMLVSPPLDVTTVDGKLKVSPGFVNPEGAVSGSVSDGTPRPYPVVHYSVTTPTTPPPPLAMHELGPLAKELVAQLEAGKTIKLKLDANGNATPKEELEAFHEISRTAYPLELSYSVANDGSAMKMTLSKRTE